MDYTTFKEKIYRRLGNTWYQVELDDEQFDDCFGEALDYYTEFHIDGSDPSFYILDLISGQTRYQLDDDIKSVVGYYRSAEYPDLSFKKLLYEWNPQILTTDLISYSMFNAYIEEVDIIGGAKYDFHFNETTKIFTLNNLEDRTSIALKIYTDESVDNLTKILENRWLQKYTECLCGIQMSDNIDHYDGTILGGGKVNYERIAEKYNERKERLEEELFQRFTKPAPIIFG